MKRKCAQCSYPRNLSEVGETGTAKKTLCKKFNPCIKCGAEGNLFNIFSQLVCSLDSGLYVIILCRKCNNMLFSDITYKWAKHDEFILASSKKGDDDYYRYQKISQALCRCHWNKANPLPDVEVKDGVYTFNKAGHYVITHPLFSKEMIEKILK